MKYNHNRELSDFQEEINLIKKKGFKPIAVTQMYLEDVFVFETDKEANLAYQALEKCKSPKVIGWWYGKDVFIKNVEVYQNEYEKKVKIFWLD
jgi:hypothetical protein